MTEEHVLKIREELELRSEEVQELFGQIPPWIIRWGMTVIFLILAFILIGSWFFRYPEILTASIVLTTAQPPAAIVARTSGKLDRLLVEDHQSVTAGQVLARIGSTARYEDVAHVKMALETLRHSLFTGEIPSSPTIFRADAVVGELQAAYANVRSRYAEYQQAARQQSQQQRLASLDEQIQKYQGLLTRSTRQTDVLQQERDLAQRQYARYRQLHKEALVAQNDLEALESIVLQKTSALEAAHANADEIRLQIAKLDASKQEIILQSDEQQQTLTLALAEACEQLSGQIAAWEHAYLLIAPIDGVVTFTNVWSANQNVNSGEMVMTVVPKTSDTLVGKVELPVRGAGKVQAGQAVQIKFVNFPAAEYGLVTGKVERISLVPSNQHYVVEVSLPNGLTTTYGTTLTFTQEMPGTADIITEDARLLERFLRPLRALFKQTGQ